MRFMMIYHPERNGQPPRLPSCQEAARMQQFIEEEMRSGRLLATEGLNPTAKTARVRQSNGKVSVQDGPFAETKELIGGFAIIRADSLDEAIDSARRFMAIGGDGETEILQICEPADFVQAGDHAAASSAC